MGRRMNQAGLAHLCQERRGVCSVATEEGKAKAQSNGLVTFHVGGFGLSSQQSGLCESPFLFHFHLLGPCCTSTVYHPQRQERVSLLSLLSHPFTVCLH